MTGGICSTDMNAERGRCVKSSAKGRDNFFYCECKEGYYGDDCSYGNTSLFRITSSLLHVACPGADSNNICNHQGKCMFFQDHTECICNPGYFGANCDIRKSFHWYDAITHLSFKVCPGMPNSICNGHGQCGFNNATQTTYCTCDPGSYGLACEYRIYFITSQPLIHISLQSMPHPHQHHHLHHLHHLLQQQAHQQVIHPWAAQVPVESLELWLQAIQQLVAVSVNQAIIRDLSQFWVKGCCLCELTVITAIVGTLIIVIVAIAVIVWVVRRRRTPVEYSLVPIH
jgi:hypothetical protein